LSPIKQSRELYPLDATLDSKPQEQPVEMCFDRSLSNMEILSDFCVVASLQQQINDLLLAGPHFIELLIHKTLHLTDAPWSPQVALEPGPETPSGFGSFLLLCVSFCIHPAKVGLRC
jgi:hypothetical protein